MKKILLFLSLSMLISGCREDIVDFQEEIGTGRIYLSSHPSGAEIYFENNKTGKVTPDSLISLVPGSYTIKLHLTGYPDEFVDVNVTSGARRFINISFRSY